MKTFTVEEANALMPTVRPTVEGLRRAYRRVSSGAGEARRAAEGAGRGGGGFARGSSHYVQALIDLAEHAGQLEALGVQVKDYDRGLIDFPSLRDGRVVLLCWQAGEGDEVEWWHEQEAGFAGRQPL